ncbi:37226_t:CDS:2, partial [Gigaspora margarita]
YSQEADRGDAIEKLEICGHDIVHNECKVDYNRIEAADESGISMELTIEKDEVKTFIDYQKFSIIKNVSRSCNYGQCNEMEKKKYTRNRMLFVSNYSMYRRQYGNVRSLLIAQNNKEKVKFYNRLHLDHMVGNDELVSAVFGNHFEIRKPGRMDVTLGF